MSFGPSQAAAHRKIMRAIRRMTPEEFMQSLKDAGVGWLLRGKRASGRRSKMSKKTSTQTKTPGTKRAPVDGRLDALERHLADAARRMVRLEAQRDNLEGALSAALEALRSVAVASKAAHDMVAQATGAMRNMRREDGRDG